MYLNYLKENEKIAFLKLAHIVANSDNEICENEKIIIGSYCNEMGINDTSFNLEDVSISILANEFSSVSSKKITILELMSVINANGEFKNNEKEIINKLLEKFNLEDKFLENVELWSKSLMTLIEQGTSLVLED